MESKTENYKEMLRNMGQQMMQRAQQEKQQKVKNFKTLNKHVQKKQILFTGSSLMEQFPVCELAASYGVDKKVYNRGIGGYTTDEFLQEADTVLFDLEPSKVFINIGTNDMKEWEDKRDWMEHLLGNYETILKLGRERLPETEFYVMAYYPVNAEAAGNDPGTKFMLKVRTNENIALVNERIARLAADYGCFFLDANEGLADEKGNLKPELTVEGIHMYAEAYEIIFNNIKQYL